MKIRHPAMLVVLLALAAIMPPSRAGDVTRSKGFEHFYNLEYDEAIAEFRSALETHPQDPELYNHIAQSILYREMFRAGALESELVSGTNPFLRRPKMNPSAEGQKAFDEAIRKAMALSESRLKTNPNDVQAMYALGVSFGLRANYNFLVRKAWFDALKDATRSRKLHNRVTELDKSMIDARLIQGVHDYVVGSLPWHIRTLGFLVGFRGDKEGGIRTLEFVSEYGKINKYDAQVLLCAIYRRERKPGKAVPLLTSLIRRFPRNYLLRFELAQMYSDLGEKTKALAVLEEVERLRAAGAAGFLQLPSEKIDYARGTIQFWYNDLEQALANMKKVTARAHQLDLNTEVYAWMRLGQIHDLRGERSLAVLAYREAISRAPESDPARESRRYLSTPYRRAGQKG